MTTKKDDMPIRKIDHVRFFVGNARQSAYFYRNAYGFDVVAYAGLETKVKNEAGYVLKQGGIHFVLISPLRASHPESKRLIQHGDGVSDIALQVDDVAAAYSMAVERGAQGVVAPQAIEDISHIADEMRLIKSDFEIDIMKRSAKIATLAHNRAMKSVRPNMYEYELEAEILHEFMSHGVRAPAYQSIVAAGKNACTLHYVDNNSKIQDGDLILIDAGCELEGYASDVSRTFPTSGKFSKIQKDFYQLVLEAQSAALSKVSSNHNWNEPHEAALSVLIDGFKDFGLCQGSHQEIYETGAYKEFYMHRTGHWLGLDVHDAGDYKTIAHEWKQLKPGMTLTVEPGCYIRPSANIPKEFWNIGIRIEDDVLVTHNGYEVLTKDSPKTIESIETLMAK